MDAMTLLSQLGELQTETLYVPKAIKCVNVYEVACTLTQDGSEVDGPQLASGWKYLVSLPGLALGLCLPAAGRVRCPSGASSRFRRPARLRGRLSAASRLTRTTAGERRPPPALARPSREACRPPAGPCTRTDSPRVPGGRKPPPTAGGDLASVAVLPQAAAAICRVANETGDKNARPLSRFARSKSQNCLWNTIIGGLTGNVKERPKPTIVSDPRPPEEILADELPPVDSPEALVKTSFRSDGYEFTLFLLESISF
ncbi:uncharacterized protein WM294_001191 [Sarcoramphus papa]